jgi:hypothetical protein
MANTQKLSCHIIGLNPYTKKDFIDKLNNKIFNVIDLDNINKNILADDELDKMYKMFMKLKNDKNDKFKEVDKKMTQFWEQSFVQKVEEKIKQRKTNILIGMNNHYKGLNRRIPIDCTNKFIITSNEDDIKNLIRYNLETHKEEIIAGVFPLDYLNYDFLLKKKTAIETTYKKCGYIEKSLDHINNMLKLIEKNTDMKEIWISMKEPYNVGSLIHPIQDNIITGYNDMNIAIIASINFNDDEVKKVTNKGIITLKEIKPKGLSKLKTKRFLYLVESNTFVPDENSTGDKFFSQVPVKIIAKEKIDSVNKFFEIK